MSFRPLFASRMASREHVTGSGQSGGAVAEPIAPPLLSNTPAM
jgi:hypothetical protein